MQHAQVVSTEDLLYKGGFVHCDACNWHHELGDGFNGYHVNACPSCTPDLETRSQRKVVYNDKIHSGLRVDIGHNGYFVLSNGIHVRYETSGIQSHFGLTEKQADRL